MSENIAVRIGECQCPDTPHADGDFVFLRPKLAWRHVTAIKWDILAAKEQEASADLAGGEILGILSEGYLLHGIAEWNLKDEKGKPLSVSKAGIQTEILEDVERASMIADEADRLYGPQVMVPLARLGARSSASTQSNGSTSATTGSPVAPRKRSKRSSTSTSLMDSTETITSVPAGDSNS